MRLLARLPAHTKLGVPNIEQREKVASPQHVFNFDSTRPDDVSLEVDLITRYLPINERLVFASSPVRWRDPLARKAALAFINAYESQMHVNIRRELEGMGLVESLDKVRKLKRDWDRQRKYVNTKKLSEDHNGVIIDDKDLIRLDQTTLQMLESLHATLVLYMWLSYRLPLGFYQASQAQIMKNEVEKGIEWCLERIRSKKIKNADSSFEEEVEEKPTEHHIEYLTRGEVERWRREGMTSAAWGDLLENARRATG
jgi:ATP-dependent RNA helicase SUPV3L1/SUV3